MLLYLLRHPLALEKYSLGTFIMKWISILNYAFLLPFLGTDWTMESRHLEPLQQPLESAECLSSLPCSMSPLLFRVPVPAFLSPISSL